MGDFSILNEKRTCKRVSVTNSSIMLRDGENRGVDLSIIRDISENGIGIATRKDIDVGAIVFFKFAIPQMKGNSIEGSGKVKWKVKVDSQVGDPLYLSGLRIEKIELDSVRRLRDYIKKQARNN